MLAIGDRVRLKSGGPLMTVCDVEYRDGKIGAVRCAWMTRHDELRVETLVEDILVLWTPPFTFGQPTSERI